MDVGPGNVCPLRLVLELCLERVLKRYFWDTVILCLIHQKFCSIKIGGGAGEKKEGERGEGERERGGGGRGRGGGHEVRT